MKTLFTMLPVFLLLGCLAGQDPVNYTNHEGIATGNTYTIWFDRAIPENASQGIDISGQSYFMDFQGKHVRGYLPHIKKDQRRGSNFPIEFDGRASSYTSYAKPGKRRIKIKIADKNRPGEKYQLKMWIHDRGNVEMELTSSERSGISFRGKVHKTESIRRASPRIDRPREKANSPRRRR